MLAAISLALVIVLVTPNGMAQAPDGNGAAAAQDNAAHFPGMDESVNVDLAKKAGVRAQEPYLNVEEWGELWNLILLLGGGVCGFVIGRRWDQLWGRPR
jgi:hypothetical protein